MNTVLKTPRLTEKSINQKEATNQVTFMVAPEANKIEIRSAIERLFKVKVLKVRTLNVLGKIKRMGRHAGKRQDWKKAVVTLKEGDKIEYFEGA